MIASGGRQWFTAAEIADLALPGMPHTKRKVNERADRENWALAIDEAGVPRARPRKGRGGGLEYHLSLLPDAAKGELVRRGLAFVPANDEDAVSIARQAHGWSWYDMQSDAVKAEATRRASILAMVEAFQVTGMTVTAAVTATSQSEKVGSATIYNWLRLVKGLPQGERLPALAPRRKGGGREAEVDPGAWDQLKGDYLRPEAPTFSSCYWRTVHLYAAPRGITLPSEKTMLRKLEREVDPRFIIAKRKGMDAVKAMVPAQQRTVAHLHAMAMVNIDGHKFDVFVRFPDGKIDRPILVGIQDIYSRMMLAWRVGDTESALLTRLAFADLMKRHGIPKHCVMDNGRAFASKWISGGLKNRFRFKIREEEPLGLLPSLGIGVTWTLPYSGQSKPIERAWRDVADMIAKDPRCAGAWSGNHVDNKPENYRDTAVPLDHFLTIVEQGMLIHNERTGRQTETTRGGSFAETFAESYACSPIGRATEEHLRLGLLTGEQIKADRKSGFVKIADNRYWTPALSMYAGQLLTVRFDPDDLSLPVHVYDNGGHFLCTAERWEASRFDDMASAKRTAKLRGDMRKAVRKAGEIERLLTAEQVAAQMRMEQQATQVPEPAVIRPTRHRGSAALKTVSEAAPATSHDQFMGQLSTAIGRLKLVD
ncbi:transposase domain-containing protein [Sphingobium yanoikuyae]|uniref:transposase domain-containing protein n=1 Tax=Sphingobium yanoikuyae TaxID=13690 RepID=UPI0026ED210D|nr:transposase domain-containing protein [Sphingobium yanoikuyae]